MAGAHPDTPGVKLPYDMDGTDLSITNVGNSEQRDQIVSVAGKEKLNGYRSYSNDADFYGADGASRYQDFIFPQPRNLTGIYCGRSYVSAGTFNVTVYDGGPNAWSGTNPNTVLSGESYTLTGNYTRPSDVRSGIIGFSAPNTKIMRVYSTHVLSTIHVYAVPEARNGLYFCNLDGTPLTGAGLDFGDSPRRSSGGRVVRVANGSATSTATDIVVSFDAPHDYPSAITWEPNDPPTAGQLMVSMDQRVWTASVTITSLPPGAISLPIYVLYGIAPDAVLGHWPFRMTAIAGGWF